MHALAVDVHLEHAAPARDELDLYARQIAPDLGGQTGRPGLVVSDRAVFDADVHVVILQSQGQRPKKRSSAARR